MADRDNYIELCDGGRVPRDWPVLPFSMLPGRVAVWMFRPEVSDGGLCLPVSGRCAPDVGVLASEHAGLPVGTVVAVTPYRGAWLEDDEGREYRFFGVTESSEEAIPLVWDGEWRAAPGWTLAKPLKRCHEALQVETVEQGVVESEGRTLAFDPTARFYVPFLDMQVLRGEVLAEVG